MVKKIAQALGLITFFAAAGAPTGFAQATTDTDEVWAHHIQAWESRSLDDIVSDYSEDSILILNSQLFKGPTEIRNVFAQLFPIFDRGDNRIDRPLVTGRIVYITWHFTPTADQEFYGTDTFVIEDGKIAVQTIASPLYESYPISAVLPPY